MTLLLAFPLGVPAPPPAGAQAPPPFTFRRVAAVGDSAPGGGGFTEFLGAPSLDRGQVAFRAIAVEGETGRLGVFLSDKTGAGVATVADTQTPIPGGSGSFASFGALSLDGGKVAVIGFGGDPSSGIYLGNGSSALAEVARSGGVVSEENPFVRLNAFLDLSLSQGKAAFLADVQIQDFLTFALVGGDGALLALLAPGFPFGTTSGCCVAQDGDQVVFSVEDPVGVFSATGGAVTVIADPTSSIAGSLFTVLDRPALHRGRVVFVAAGPSRQGVFAHDGTGFAVVADTATLVPDGAGTAFFSFGQPSVHNGAVAFLGCGVAGCGVYTTLGGALAKVIAPGDSLDGRTVAEVDVSREALSCGSVAFRAAFQDGSQGVYRADLQGAAPCPSGLDSVTALTLWGGLKDSDDQGTAFDVRAEIRAAGALVVAGEARCVTGLSRNATKAQAIRVEFPGFAPAGAEEGDLVTLTVLARIGTDGSGGRCKGRGASHAGAAGLRVYFGSVHADSGFGIGAGGEAARRLFLESDGPACLNRPGPPGTILSLVEPRPRGFLAKCADSRAVRYRDGNPWQEVGTWSTSLSTAGAAADAAPRWWRWDPRRPR